MKPRLLSIGLIGLTATLLILMAVYRKADPPVAEQPAPAAANLPPAAEPAEAAEAPSVPREPPEATAPIRHSEPVAPAPPAAKQAPQPVRLRISGMVEDSQGLPLEGVQLRWIPLEKMQAWQFSRDAALIDGDASRLPEGSLREAFLQSRTARSGPGGAYSIEMDWQKSPLGIVIAAARGYEISLKRVVAAPVKSAAGSSSRVRQAVLDFQLGFAGVISGTVRDRVSGQGAEGMSVAAQAHTPDSSPMLMAVAGQAPAALVDAQGRYSIQGLSPGEYWVAPKTGSSDYVGLNFQSGRKVTLEAGSEIVDLDFEVDRGGRISGRFLLPDGQPAQGVECYALPVNLAAIVMSGDLSVMESLNRGRQSSGADGDFEFRGLRLGRSYRVQGSVRGMASLSSDPVPLSQDSPQAELELVLSRGSTVFGRVLRQDGQPAPDAQVSASIENLNPLDVISAGGIQRAQSDSQGRFELKNLTAGKYRVMAGDELILASMLTASQDQKDSPQSAQVEVDGRSDVRGIVLTLDESEQSRIAGMVVDDLGQPLDKVMLMVSNVRSSFHSSAQSGPEGGFSIQTRGEGPFQIMATHNRDRKIVRGIEPGRQDVRIEFSRSGHVSGRVVVPGGPSVPKGARVEARQASSEDPMEAAMRAFMPSQHFAVPQQDGAFRIEVPAGQVEIEARVPGFAPALAGPVEVLPGEETGGIEVRLAQGAALLGTVVLKNGTPLDGAIVQAVLEDDDLASQIRRSSPFFRMMSGEQATTDQDGRFELPRLQPGKYAVSASYRGQAPSDPLEVRLEEGQTREVRLELSAGGAISGLIVDGEVPQPGKVVLLSSTHSPSQSTVSDEEGRFLLEDVAAGEYGLHVSDMQAGRQGVLKSAEVVVREDETLQVVIDLAAGRRIFGSMRASSPGTFCQVVVRRPGGTAPQDLPPLEFAQSFLHAAGSAQARCNGDYEIRGIDPGRYLLEAYRLPEDPSDISAYQSLDRRPLFQQEIQVGERDLQIDIR